jgi:hypothetical protein
VEGSLLQLCDVPQLSSKRNSQCLCAVDNSCCRRFAACCQLQKLVSTQESLQQQLATQVDTNNAKAHSQQQEMQQLAADLQQTQAQLLEAQAAVDALSEELQVCRFV